MTITNDVNPDPKMSPLIPPDIEAIFGEPPLLRGEDDGLYITLMEKYIDLIKPDDMIEWWWVKDMTDLTWEIRRLRRFKMLFVELNRDFLHHNREVMAVCMMKQGDKFPTIPLPDREKDSADLFRNLSGEYKDTDKLIASAELRLSRTLRQIERRRADLARRLRKAADEVVEGEGVEPIKAAA
jgi:hypothetical protein